MKQLIILFSALVILIGSGCVDNSPSSTSSTSSYEKISTAIEILPVEALSSDEEQGLVFMREEEKLARDIYQSLYDIWSLPVFNNIANSEQTHTSVIAKLLERYSIDDPALNTNVGEFQNSALQTLYDTLYAQGSSSRLDALLVGAEIEEVDLIDINTYLDTVDNQDISLVYQNLMKGSRNHLRSFVQMLVAEGIEYTPLHLSPLEYELIISTPKETGIY